MRHRPIDPTERAPLNDLDPIEEDEAVEDVFGEDGYESADEDPYWPRPEDTYPEDVEALVKRLNG